MTRGLGQAIAAAEDVRFHCNTARAKTKNETVLEYNMLLPAAAKKLKR